MSQSIKLPKLLQEGCVLQRGEKTRIWGWYKPQAELEVTFQEKVYRTKCDAEGTFETEISCEKTGGPYVLSIKRCTLRTIIINAQMPIIQVPAKIVFLIQRI